MTLEYFSIACQPTFEQFVKYEPLAVLFSVFLVFPVIQKLKAVSLFDSMN